MGMESFFVKVSVERDVERLFIKKCENNFNDIIVSGESVYYFDGVVVVKFYGDVSSGFFVVFECCFSWYENGVDIIFKLIELLVEVSGCVVFVSPKISIDLGCCLDGFRTGVFDCYKCKYIEFKNIFGDVKFKSMPNDDFYVKYKKRKSFIWIAWQTLLKKLSRER